MACAKKLAISFTPEGGSGSHEIKISDAYAADLEYTLGIKIDSANNATSSKILINHGIKNALMGVYLSDIIHLNSEQDCDGDSGRVRALEEFLAKSGEYQIKITPEYEPIECAAQPKEPKKTKSLFEQFCGIIKQTA